MSPPRSSRARWPPHARSPFGDGTLSIVPIGTGHNNKIDGVIVAGSQRDDFPWQTETVILSVAANQAAVGLASARAYEQERRRNEAELERQRLHASQELLIQTSHLYRELQNREAKFGDWWTRTSSESVCGISRGKFLRPMMRFSAW